MLSRMPQIVSKNPVYEDFGFGLKFIYVCADFHISICFCLIWKRNHVRLIFEQHVSDVCKLNVEPSVGQI